MTNYNHHNNKLPWSKIVLYIYMCSMVIGTISGANVETLTTMQKTDASSGVQKIRFPGSGFTLGSKVGTELAKKTEPSKIVPIAKDIAEKLPSQVCTRSGKTCGEAATKFVRDVFGNGLRTAVKKPVSTPTTTVTSPTSLPSFGHVIAGGILAKEVKETYNEMGAGAAAIKSIGGAGTIAASSAAFASCASYGAIAGPVGSIVAGLACSIPVSIMGDQLTETVIDQHVDVDDEEQVDSDRWEPSDAQLEKCASSLSDAREYWDSLGSGVDLVTKKRLMIRWILENMANPDNALMPAECQYVVLHELMSTMGWGEMSNSDWLTLMGDGSILFDSLTNSESIMKDQMTRAREIVQKMIRDNIRSIRTMDGHGRFVYSFLKAIAECGENVDDWEIDLVDMDQGVNGWHRWFMPEGVLVEDGNIINIEQVFLDQTLVYFNFCGIGGQEEELKSAIKEIINEGKSVFISWSHRGGTTSWESPVYRFARWIKKMAKKDKATYVANRVKFFTYMLHPPPSE